MADQQRRLTIAHKILLIATSFSLPIAVLVYFVTATIDYNIHFSTQEVAGNAYQRPLEDLLRGLQEHQVAACCNAPGTPEVADRIGALESKMTRAFSALESVDRKLGADLQFTDEGLGKRDRSHVRVGTVQQEWAALANAVAERVKQGRSASDMGAQYEHLVSDIRTMITHAGDTSNLILDPDLDSYYLMDITLLALPQTQDRLARVTLFGSNLIARGTMTPEERVQLAVHAALLQEADLDRITASSQTSLNEDRNFYGASETLQRELPPALEEYRKSSAAFIAMTKDLASAPNPRIDREVWVESGLRATAASFDFWTVSDRELDRLLTTRIAKFEGDRQWALGLSALALVAAAALSFLMMRSITRPLSGLVRTLGPGADLLSGCVEQIADASRKKTSSAAETAIICEELNAHADDMRKAVMELVSLVEGQAAAESNQYAMSATESDKAPAREAA